MLVGKKLILRPLEREDLLLVSEWRNNPTIRPHFFTPYPIMRSKQERWYETYISRGDSMIFLIVPKDQGSPIGMIGLDHIDHQNQKAEFGRLLIADISQHKKGYAHDATLTLLNYAFFDLNINRVYLRVYADNERAIGLYQRCGFKQEGVERDAIFARGLFRDVTWMAILRREFIKK